MAEIIDGRATSLQIQDEIAEEVEKIKSNGGKVPHLAAVLVGEDGASLTYVNAKVKACERAGFGSTLVHLPEDTSEDILLAKVDELNNDNNIDGFIVQLPLPDHLSVEKVTMAIAPEKDVDGFHPVNVGRMAQGLPSYLPATPQGILRQAIRR